MSKEEQELLSSDESDEDFIPSGEENLLSEEESSGENDGDNDDKEDKNNDNQFEKKRSRHKKSGTKRRKVETNEEFSEEKEKEEDQPKLSTDQLWAEFLSGPSEPTKKDEKNSLAPKVKTVTQVCMFAGEEVKVEKQVPVSSTNSRGRGRGRGRGGLSGILGNLGKQPKLSILEKSKLDWNQFKQSEGLEEQLSTFNKGKDGYLEKQDFLQRTDIRQFEQEKELRNATRKTLR